MKRKILQQSLLLFACLVVSLLIMSLVTVVMTMFKLGNLALINTLAALAMFVLPAVLYDSFSPKKFCLIRDLKNGFSWPALVLALLLLISSNSLLSYVTDFKPITCFLEAYLPQILATAQEMEAKGREAYATMMRFDNIGYTLSTLLAVGIAPALTEEFFFRGLIQKYVLGKLVTAHVAIWVTAFIFSVIHIDIFGFIPRMAMGVIFGYAAWFSGSLWLPILLHAINNSIVVLGCLAYQNNWISTDPLGDDPVGIAALIVGIVGLVLCVFLYKRKRIYWRKSVEN